MTDEKRLPRVVCTWRGGKARAVLSAGGLPHIERAGLDAMGEARWSDISVDDLWLEVAELLYSIDCGDIPTKWDGP